MKPTSKLALQALAIALVILLGPAAGYADGFLDDDLSYEFESGSDTKVRVIYRRNPSATHITIPSTVVYEYTDGKDEAGHYILKHRTCRVTSIGDSAFSGCSGLTSVAIPDSVTSIGSYAFWGCSGLTSVAIPDSVTSIGGMAFWDCSGLTSVAIGNSVTSIGGGAFEDCSGLTSVAIGNSVTSIGDSAFSGCSGLTSVAIPDSVTSIGASAFSGCSGLTSVAIPDSVTSIGNRAFDACSGLTSVTILGNVTEDYRYYPPFSGCTNIESIVLGEKMTKIGNYMFCGCSKVQSLTIPDRVTSIGDKAFGGCTSLTRVTVLGNVTNDWSRRYHPFHGCPNIESIVLGEKMTKIVDNMFCGCPKVQSLTIPDSVASIGSYAFSGCSGLTSVTIPNSVTSIGEAAFSSCRGLTSVTIGNSVTSIGDYVFQDCSGLTSVTIPGSVTNIGDYAFRVCSGLTSVTIPDSMVSIGRYAFSGCSDLTSVTFGGVPPRVDEEYSPFSDVASGARGYYTANHAAEWDEVIVDGKWQGLIMSMIGPKGCWVRLHRNGWKATPEEDDFLSLWVDFGEKLPEKPFERGACKFYGWSAGTPDFVWGLLSPGTERIEDGAAWNPTEAEWEAWRGRGWLVQEADGTYGVDLYGVWGTRTKVVFYNMGGGGSEWLAPDGLKDHLQGQIDETGSILRSGECVDLLPGAHSFAVTVGNDAASYAATWSARTEPEVEWATTGDAATLECNSDGQFTFRIPGKYPDTGPVAGGKDPTAELTLYVRVLPPGEKSGMVTFNCQGKLSEAQWNAFEGFPPFDLSNVALRIRRMRTETQPEDAWFGVSPVETCPLAAGAYQVQVDYAEPYWNLYREATGLPDAGFHTVLIAVEDGDDRTVPLFFAPFGDGEGLYYRVLFDGNGGMPSEKEWWYLHTGGRPFGWSSWGHKGMPTAVPGGRWMFAGWFTSSTGGRVVDYNLLTEWMKNSPRYRILHAQWKPLDPGYVAWAESLGMTDANLPTDLDTDGDGQTNWEEYVAGTNPKDENDFLKTRLEWVDGQPVASPALVVPATGREIRVQGKKSMSEGDWEDVTGVEDKDAAGWRFFRVRVKMEEE